jgi:hypothetical protein
MTPGLVRGIGIGPERFWFRRADAETDDLAAAFGRNSHGDAGRPGAVIAPSMCASSLRGNRKISPPAGSIRTGPHRESDEPKPMMYGDEKSNPFIVARKAANGDG